MKQIIDAFDRAYIINLEDRSDRRRGCEREFQKLGIEVPSEKIRFYTAIRPTEQGLFPTLGSRGSFTSHRAVLDLAIQDDLKNLLVFEDDICFRDIEPRVLEKMANELSRISWDVIYFGYEYPRIGAVEGPLIPCPGVTIGGHFYAVNGAFMREMSRYMHDCETRPSDHPDGGATFRDGAYNDRRARTREIKTFLAVPSLAGQRSSRTDLHPLKFYDRLKFMRPVVNALRMAKNRWRSP